MEAATIQRHFKPTQGWRVAKVSRLTATQFVAAVVRAGQDNDWICFQAGIAGVAFALSNDTRRHARLLFERDREMGAGGNAAPVVLFGDDQHDLFEVASDDVASWTIHLRNRRNSVESDIRFLRALFSVLRL